jgi:hypothetical protein
MAGVRTKQIMVVTESARDVPGFAETFPTAFLAHCYSFFTQTVAGTTCLEIDEVLHHLDAIQSSGVLQTLPDAITCNTHLFETYTRRASDILRPFLGYTPVDCTTWRGRIRSIYPHHQGHFDHFQASMGWITGLALDHGWMVYMMFLLDILPAIENLRIDETLEVLDGRSSTTSTTRTACTSGCRVPALL